LVALPAVVAVPVVVGGGTRIDTLNDRGLTRLRREKLGFVFQNFNLLPTLTAAENVSLPAAISGSKPDRQWFTAVIDTLGLADRLSHRPSQLSGGQQQRVALARALVTRLRAWPNLPGRTTRRGCGSSSGCSPPRRRLAEKVLWNRLTTDAVGWEPVYEPRYRGNRDEHSWSRTSNVNTH
jgi:ABC transporter